MKRINKQKFLAELGRLLTFMYEEDRQTALAMYNRMFDEAENEQALLQFFVSPTRQAVVLARAYNAKERKLQVHTQSRDEYEQNTDEIPDFVLAINKLQEEASSLKITTSQVSEDQISLFDDNDTAAISENEPAPAAAAPEYTAHAADEEAETLTETEEAPVQEGIPPMFKDEPAEEMEQDEMSSSVTRLADAVDAFLADFTISNDELIPKTKPAEEEEAEPEKAEPAAAEEAIEVSVEETSVEQPDETEVHEPVYAEPEAHETEAVEVVEVVEAAEEDKEDAGTVRKPIIPLLILYIIFAIPLGLIGTLLLLIPTLMSLSLAITAGVFGIYGFAATFTGFVVLADILVVAGVSLILLALALLFLWLFVWFIGGAIVGLIRGLCVFGGKWCYKEVAVQ